MSYKKSASSNRDALFGGASSAAGGPKYKKNASSNRDALFGGSSAAGSGGGGTGSMSSRDSASKSTTPEVASSRGYKGTSTRIGGKDKKLAPTSALSGEARAKALKEAEEYKEKANKVMQSGLFSRPDPVAASTFYKRAADAYQRAGEFTLERFYRISSGDCNLQIGAWASAAGDYTRAADLLLQAEDIKSMDQKRRDASNYHKKAAEAFLQMNEKGKAAACNVQAAIALTYGDESRLISKEALAGLEEAVEAHVPDIFNAYARYRQTGQSAFLDPNNPDETVSNPSQQTMELAQSQLVTRAYAHEPLQNVAHLLVQQGEYASALYAAGAATTILEHEGVSTLSLGRAYCTEIILLLALGDPVAAEEQFLNRHVQNTAYLSTRECKLSEELFRAVKTRDADALEEARSPSGSNRAALANLHESLRVLVTELRLSGVARRNVADTTSSSTKSSRPKKAAPDASRDSRKTTPATMTTLQPPEDALAELKNRKTGYEKEAAVEGQVMDASALQSELDALDFGDDSGDEEDDLDDDDIDLR